MTLFHPVAHLADQLAAEASRLKKRAAIAEAIASTHEQSPNTADAGLLAQYLAGLPFPEADPRKLNAGGALLTRAVLTVSQATDAALTAAYRSHGDLGAAAHDLLLARPEQPPTLTLAEVAEAFAQMATAKTTAIRAATVESLLKQSTPLEAKYLLKLMLGDMRIGVKQSLIEEAIAVASSTEAHTTDVAAVRHAVMLEADLASSVQRAFAGTLSEARMTLFHPLGFMLASPVDTPEEAVARFTEKPPKPEKQRKSRKPKTPAPDELTEGGAEVQTEVEEAMKQLEEEGLPESPRAIQAFLEDKYDGMRAQIHCGDSAFPGRVAIYSRNREDITDSFPDLAEAFAHVHPDHDSALILDGEILAWDFCLPQPPEPGAPPSPTASSSVKVGSTPEVVPHALPFATLGTRIGRKKVSDELRTQVPAIFMVFDLLYAGGELLLDLPLRDRRNRLEAAVERMATRIVSPLAADPANTTSQQTMFADPTAPISEHAPVTRLMISPSRLVESAQDIDRAYADARARANEGVMLKAANSKYLPGRRGLSWVKLKRELGSLDVVITGAEFGSGRRAPFLSDYTFAIRGPEHDLLNVGKAYSGVTDVEITELTEFLKLHTLEDHGHFRTVEPLVILEVAFNNIMRSTRHASGFALRFPRILRIRTDKPLEEIDTLARVEELYLSQIDRPVEAWT